MVTYLVVAAVLVDVVRLLVYGVAFYAAQFPDLDPGTGPLVLAATLAAFAGSFLGARLLKKVTLCARQLIVGVMLVGIGISYYS
jgi:uncharacterized protein